MIYMSSVGTFDGKKKGKYQETDVQKPINIYGKTKLKGEDYTKKYVKHYCIVRAGWMIGGLEKDKKFVKKLKMILDDGSKEIKVVTDKFGTPTYTYDLAQILGSLIRDNRKGIFHVACDGEISRYDVASEMLKLMDRKDVSLLPVSSDKVADIFFSPRPDNETVNINKIKKLYPQYVRPWKEVLKHYAESSTNFSQLTMKQNKPVFSIVICLYVIVPRFFEDLKKFEKLKYRNFEVLIVADKKVDLPKLNFPVKLILTGKNRTGVGEKRDVAIKIAKGKYIAYIDDDAYPDPEWLTNAVLDFKHPHVGAVGGPNMTPLEDSYWSQIGGHIYESYLMSGGAQNRFLPTKKQTVTELQGVNLIIRKEVLEKIGGFSTKLFSGDDTKVCYSIRILGMEVLYDPNVRVFHHRREFPKNHLRQLRTMGTHRGYFVKRYPLTSLYPIYFLPSGLFLGTIFALFMSLFVPNLFLFLIWGYIIFFLLIFASVVRRIGVIKGVFTSIGVISSHLTYGAFFLKGLFFTKNLEHA